MFWVGCQSERCECRTEMWPVTPEEKAAVCQFEMCTTDRRMNRNIIIICGCLKEVFCSPFHLNEDNVHLVSAEEPWQI